MKLLTQEIRAILPTLYSTEHITTADKIAVCKFFLGNWTWFVCEAANRSARIATCIAARHLDDGSDARSGEELEQLAWAQTGGETTVAPDVVLWRTDG